MAVVKNGDRTRRIHFGHSQYGQFKDLTKLKLFKHKDHRDPRRRKNFLKRFTGLASKTKALESELRKNNKKMSPLILSILYLW